MTDAKKFLNALATKLSNDERLILIAFRGDPNDAPTHAWRPRPWRPGNDIPFSAKNNAYTTVASFGKVADGGFRRRRDSFKAGHALLIDDVHTKVPYDIVKRVKPTAIVETSPGNEQWWYMLSEPERDYDKFDQVIRAFIRDKLLGNDPGQAGVTRVGRLPSHVNAKEKYGGNFITKLVDFEPQRLFAVDELVKKFKLTLEGRRMPPAAVDRSTAVDRINMFYTANKFLERRKMFKRKQPDPSGWREMTCPWKDEHTAAADTGAAIREPHPENQYYGAFRCHHGSHAGKGWRELTDWISDLAAEELDK